MSQINFRSPNRLLTLMSPEDLALVVPHLTHVALDVRTWLEHPNKPISSVYFLESGIVSVVACATPDWCIESGLIGDEGMSGSTVILGDDRSPHQSYVQVAGSAQRMNVDDLRAAMASSPSLTKLLLRYVQAFTIQTSHTGLANGRGKIEARLARWLLMAQDRIHENELPLTHEFISTMLGVRRPGVTDTLHHLEGRGLIRSNRGALRIIDREGLIDAAGGAYGIPEAEYARLLS